MKRSKLKRRGTPTMRLAPGFGGKTSISQDELLSLAAPADLRCTVCTTPIEDFAARHVAWWGGLPVTGGPVRAFEVLCSPHCVRFAAAKHDLPERAASRHPSARPSLESSWPLDWCTGPARAVWFMQELVWIYRWEQSSEPLRKMLDFVIIAAQLPAAEIQLTKQDRPPTLAAFPLQPVGGAS